jgi:hypothetical protein
MKENPLELFIESMVKELGPDKLNKLVDRFEQIHKQQQTDSKQ